jgi:hypothetical protein
MRASGGAARAGLFAAQSALTVGWEDLIIAVAGTAAHLGFAAQMAWLWTAF